MRLRPVITDPTMGADNIHDLVKHYLGQLVQSRGETPPYGPIKAERDAANLRYQVYVEMPNGSQLNIGFMQDRDLTRWTGEAPIIYMDWDLNWLGEANKHKLIAPPQAR